MRLVACGSCHTQYDVTSVVDAEITCRCGEKIANRSFEGVEAQVHRCGSCGAQVAPDSESCAYCGAAIVRDSHELSLICPECYARNAEDSRFCTACGVSFSPQQVEIEGHELPCPCCGCLMPVRAIGGMGINECPECNGLWVPDNRFDQLVAQACEAARQPGARVAGAADPRVRSGNPARARVVYRKCPVCDAHMQRSNFRKRSGVIVDRCHTHGTWLDADELEKIAGFILAGGMGPGGARDYVLRTELDAARRRDAAALARAMKGESIVVERRGEALGDGLIGLLKSLLS